MRHKRGDESHPLFQCLVRGEGSGEDAMDHLLLGGGKMRTQGVIGGKGCSELFKTAVFNGAGNPVKAALWIM